MQFYVEIDFRKGASFSTTLEAVKEDDAKHEALKFARDCGFDGTPKKIKVRPA